MNIHHTTFIGTWSSSLKAKPDRYGNQLRKIYTYEIDMNNIFTEIIKL